MGSYAWITDICRTWEGSDPAALLEHLMAQDECPAFGPVHHVLTGAALLACMRRPEGADLDERLELMCERGSLVPGASCAQWGVCGAAASCGMAFAIAAGNAPLRAEGWSEAQLMVAAILERIARAGAPRCCKRDTRIAVREAAAWFNRELDAGFELADTVPVCAVSDKNSACLKGSCPYHRGA